MAQQTFLNERIIFHPHTGTLSLTFGIWTPVRGGTAAVHYRAGDTLRRLALAGPDISLGLGKNMVTFSQHEANLRLDWSWTTSGETLEAWLEVTNQDSNPITLDRLDVLCLSCPSGLDLPAPVADWRFYQNGWQSWTPSGIRRVGDGPFPTPAGHEYRLKHLPHGDGLRSQWVTLFTAETGREESPTSPQEIQQAAPPPDSRHLLLGFVTAADQLAEIILDVDEEAGAISAACHTDGISLAPGQSIRSERLQIAAGPDGWQLLEAWAGRLGQLMQARFPDKTPTGWCTWYQYFGFNTAKDVYANLNAIRRHHLPLELVMIDDGYQAAIGDWLVLNDDRFTNMAAVSATIRREGRIPGIWTAPFGLDVTSSTFTNHPDWVLRDEKGEPIFAWNHRSHPIYALDTTHPGVADWLHATFQTLRHEWGYDAFKVDFLFAAALSGRRHDPQITRAQALRRGLAIIRDAIGDDAFLLGCGLPLGPAVGLVDAMRIGPDVAPSWDSPFGQDDLSAPGTANSLRNSITRVFTHRRLWLADPDCLLARPRSTASQLSLYETRTLATVITLTGGLLLDSDRVGSLPPSRLAMLRQTLPPIDQTARPVDLLQSDPPECLVLPVERPWGDYWLVSLINWGDHTRTTTIELSALGLPPGRYHVYDQWRAEYLGQTDGMLTLPGHRPHETLLLLLKPVIDQPDWLTSTFHLAAGSVEVGDIIRQKLGERRQKLIVHMEQPGKNFGRLVFTLPKGWVVLDAKVNGRRRAVNVRDQQARLVDMGFTLRHRAWVLVDFACV